MARSLKPGAGATAVAYGWQPPYPAVGPLLHRLQRRAGELEDAFAGDVGLDGGRADRPDIDERDRDAPRGEQTAHVRGLVAFRVERGEQEDGRHREPHYIEEQSG